MSQHEAKPAESTFWSRQFAQQSTPRRLSFDIAFGIIVPMFCLVLDPIVFRSGVDTPLLKGYEILGMTPILMGWLSLTAWLSMGRPAALLSGLMAGGALYALLLGIFLLPYSGIGMIFLIGFLGYTPFITAFAFWRNAAIAFQRARQSGIAAILPAFLGFVIACACPFAAQFYVNHETSRALVLIQADDPETVGRGIVVLRRIGIVAGYDRLVDVYAEEESESRRGKLVKAYRELTGSDIEVVLSRLRD